MFPLDRNKNFHQKYIYIYLSLIYIYIYIYIINRQLWEYCVIFVQCLMCNTSRERSTNTNKSKALDSSAIKPWNSNKSSLIICWQVCFIAWLYFREWWDYGKDDDEITEMLMRGSAWLPAKKVANYIHGANASALNLLWLRCEGH